MLLSHTVLYADGQSNKSPGWEFCHRGAVVGHCRITLLRGLKPCGIGLFMQNCLSGPTAGDVYRLGIRSGLLATYEAFEEDSICGDSSVDVHRPIALFFLPAVLKTIYHQLQLPTTYTAPWTTCTLSLKTVRALCRKRAKLQILKDLAVC